jgi:hypothetical protein
MPVTVLPTLAAPDQVTGEGGWRLPAMADPCPAHPEILLPRASRVLCPICAQDRRRASYAAQLVQWQSSVPLTLHPAPAGPDGPHGQGPEPGALAPAATAGDLHNDE